jgi:hypothetical protein
VTTHERELDAAVALFLGRALARIELDPELDRLGIDGAAVLHFDLEELRELVHRIDVDDLARELVEIDVGECGRLRLRARE